MSRHQNARQNHDIKERIDCFENVAKCRYLGTTVTNQEMRGGLNSGNVVCLLACYRDVKIKIYKTIICLLFCMGVKLDLSQ
jgi:hypothetical protein